MDTPMDNGQRTNGLSDKAMNCGTFDPNKERTAENMSEIYKIQLNQMNMVSGSLCNGNGNNNHVAIMVDSGAMTKRNWKGRKLQMLEKQRNQTERRRRLMRHLTER